MREINLVGTIRKGREIGRDGSDSYIFQSCPGCGENRWVGMRNGKSVSKRCTHCHGKRQGALSNAWRGGRSHTKAGYIMVWLRPDNPFYPMSNSSHYVMEHRLVMAKHLGRCLNMWELVHHKNHIRDDNRIENLKLMGTTEHNQLTLLENRIRLLEQRVILLEADNLLLRSTIQ